MKNRKIKITALILTPLILLFLLGITIPNKTPKDIYTSTGEIGDYKLTNSPIYSNKIESNKLNINLFGLITVKSVDIKNVKDLEVYPGGTPVGIKLSSKGVLVVGYSDIQIEDKKISSPAKEIGIEIGDLILKINNEDVEDSQDLVRKVSSSETDEIKIEVSKNGKSEIKTLNRIKATTDGKYKIGLWVRDSTAGVGTLTFSHKETGYYGALGHAIIDGDTNSLITVKKGDLVKSSIINVRKSEKGSPGELRGIFLDEESPLGLISQNTYCGIFGKLNENYQSRGNPMKVGFRDEIKEGKAQILTTVDENGPQYYDIKITKLLAQDEAGPKSMVIEVTDPKLLDKTGGIVQGMSGSPIIQNGKIVGAVTHVLINNPKVGYGIYIEWMLKDAQIIK